MIIDSFDNQTEPIISPSAFFGDQQNYCDIAIATFSRVIYSEVLKLFPNEKIGEIKAANLVKTIHLLDVSGLKIAFYLSEIGSALASTDVIEINWKTGAKHFIYFGSAGALDQGKTAGKYVIPTESYRDEGMSYHYAPPADYIKIRNADSLARLFSDKGHPYVEGRVWTTDALYRETRGQVEHRKQEGLCEANHSMDKFYVALEIAEWIIKQ